MRILTSLEAATPLSEQIILTIGNFDGVHLGHQTLLKAMHCFEGERVLLTFSNHPSSVLAQKTIPLLMTPEHKLQIFRNFGIDTTLHLPFTESLSKLSAEEFLIFLRTKLPFTHLVLGHDATIGHNREGDAHLLTSLSEKYQFNLYIIPPTTYEKTPVSSRRIRSLIQQGDFKTVGALLGRPYSILVKGHHHPELCLPPSGMYKVHIKVDEISKPGIATISTNGNISYSPEVSGESIELIFESN